MSFKKASLDSVDGYLTVLQPEYNIYEEIKRNPIKASSEPRRKEQIPPVPPHDLPMRKERFSSFDDTNNQCQFCWRRRWIILGLLTAVVILTIIIAVFAAVVWTKHVPNEIGKTQDPIRQDSKQGFQWNSSRGIGCTFNTSVVLTKAAASVDSCEASCYQDAFCTHYSYLNSKCSLHKGDVKTDDAVRAADASSQCGLRPINWNADHWAFGCRFPGRVLEELSPWKGEECGPKCQKYEGCTHVNYRVSTSTCWLLRSNARIEDAELTGNRVGYVCAIMPALVDG